MDAAVAIQCPTCAQDVISRDLAHFVRFYDGDEGQAWCGTCNGYVVWKMRVVVERDHANSTTVA